MRKIILVLVLYIITNVGIADDILNIYIGANYIADETVNRLSRFCHCRVSQNYFNDNDEMLAKIVAGASGYNVVIATSYSVPELVKMGKLYKLDKNEIPNLKYVSKKFLNPIYDPNNDYSVPYAYTPVFLAYNVDKMKELGIVPNSWAIVFEKKYLQKLKGRITMLNSVRNVFAAALLYLGKDPNTNNINDINKAKALIEMASPYWAKFDSDTYYRALIRGDIWISMSYSVDIYKTMLDAINSKSKIKLDAQLQKEGNMYELDNVVIPKTTPDLRFSYMFLNHILSPQSELELSKNTGSSVPNDMVVTKLDKFVVDKEWIYPKDMKKLYTFKSYDPKTRIYINLIWTEINMQCRDIY